MVQQKEKRIYCMSFKICCKKIILLSNLHKREERADGQPPLLSQTSQPLHEPTKPCIPPTTPGVGFTSIQMLGVKEVSSDGDGAVGG